MKKFRKRAIVFALIAAMGITSASWCGDGAAARASEKKTAQGMAKGSSGNFSNFNYTLLTIDGKEVTTSSNGGRPTILIFGRTTCGNTQTTLSRLAQSEQVQNGKVHVIYADIDEASEEAVREFASVYGNEHMDFCNSGKREAFYLGINGMMWSYAEAAGIEGGITLPLSVEIDENDQVQNVLTGVQDLVSDSEDDSVFNGSGSEVGKWDCIYFGNYYQNDTNGDGKVNLSDEKEPIRWRVLSRTGKIALLLSDKILDAGKYNNNASKENMCTWEGSDMRKWLNNTFYKTAFDANEQALVQKKRIETANVFTNEKSSTQDKVFLLSREDVVNPHYGFLGKTEDNYSILTTNTAYAATKPHMYNNTYTADAQWLRGPCGGGGNSQNSGASAYILPMGDLCYMPEEASAGIRPAVYVDLSNTSLWSDAGTAEAEVLPNEGDINPEGNGAEDVPIIPEEPGEDGDTSSDGGDSDVEEPVDQSIPLNHLKFMEYTDGGERSTNVSNHEYTGSDRWSTPVKSYLKETSEGFERVEAGQDFVVAEQYSGTFQLTGQKKIEQELPLFGGCYQGDKYNFLVFGQKNPLESDDVEVMRIVKYDKDWNRLDSKAVYGANTYIPFKSGSLRIAENGGMLYIHTCHSMYMSEDGLNHQANMTFVLKEDTMGISQSYSGIMNIQYGYVSHSFNQFVKTDGTYLYRVDHGDAYPRSVVVTRAGTGSITSCRSKEILPISGETGDNDTGVEVGGFELAGDRLLIAGNTMDQKSGFSFYSSRNIFLISVDKNLNSQNTVQLTNYAAEDEVKVGNPHLVKVSDQQLYVLWEETDVDGFVTLKAACVNAEGEKQGTVHTLYARLSDCAPIYTSEGEMVWYVTQQGTPVFYHISPDKMDEYEFEGRINIKNCQVTLETEKVEYQGAGAYEPAVTVTYGGYTLKEGTDYTLQYDKNNTVGTASVLLSGQGIFQGTVEKSFQIVGKNDGSESQGSVDNGQNSSGGSGSSGKKPTQQADKQSVNSSSSSSSKTVYYSVKKPGRVTGVSVYNKKKKKMVVSWSWKMNVSGYQIQYALNKKFTNKKKSKWAGKWKSAKTISKLKKGKKYYVRVRAYRNKSGKKLYGKWSKVKKVKIKK